MRSPELGSQEQYPISRLVADVPGGGLTVDRRVFTDQAVFDAEMKYLFERTWNFVALETQVGRPNEYVTTYIGRQPILVSRSSEGVVGAFLNSCRHRGTIVCPFRHGRQKFHVCRYHGWAYDSAGRNVSITEEGAGQYPPSFVGADHDLIPVARLESYRGFIFASLQADVPPLDVYLGDAKVFLDLVVDQSATGQLEVLPGDSTYTFDGNWKLQFENGLDFYHFASTHSSYVDIMKKRQADAGDAALVVYNHEDEIEGQGSFNFNNGHAVNWSIKGGARLYGRPLLCDPEVLAEVRDRVGPVRAKWMLRQRNLTIFPNLQVIDISSAQIRTWRPLSPGKTEMISHCVGPVGENDLAREVRIRNYEDFFNASGLASSDDNLMYELGQTGYAAEAAGPTQGYARGTGSVAGAGQKYASELGISPVESAFGDLNFGGETNFYPGYREWRRFMQRADL